MGSNISSSLGLAKLGVLQVLRTCKMRSNKSISREKLIVGLMSKHIHASFVDSKKPFLDKDHWKTGLVHRINEHYILNDYRVTKETLERACDELEAAGCIDTKPLKQGGKSSHIKRYLITAAGESEWQVLNDIGFEELRNQAEPQFSMTQVAEIITTTLGPDNESAKRLLEVFEQRFLTSGRKK